MGNRAVITTEDKQMGVYLHWNGGRDSVEAFLDYCDLQGFRSPDCDTYGWARLCQVIGNFFGGGLSVGIGLYDQLDTDNGDNGVYIIKGWRIVGREFNRHAEQNSYDHADMLHDIDDSQPEHMRLGAYIDAVEVPRGELAEGDEVWVETVREGFKPFRVCGFARLPWERENGELHPFIEMCNVEEGREAVLLNPNNFIRTATVRVTR